MELNRYVLAAAKGNCNDACKKEGKTCDAKELVEIAKTVAKCKDVINNHLGKEIY